MKKRFMCFLVFILMLSVLSFGTVFGEDDDAQDIYWRESGREALWNALYLNSPQPLPDTEKAAFFIQYAADMTVQGAGTDEGTSGSFTIRPDGSFTASFSSCYEDGDETEETRAEGSGVILNVYRLSDWVYALETGEISWTADDLEEIIQNCMLFEVPGATENDEGALKYEVRTVAEESGLDPSQPVPYCFVTAFDSAPLWYGRPASGTAVETGNGDETGFWDSGAEPELAN